MKSTSIITLIFCLFCLLACEQNKPNSKEPDRLNIEQLRSDYTDTPFKVLNVLEANVDKAPAIIVTLSTPIDPQQNWREYFTIHTRSGAGHHAEITGHLPSDGWILGENLTQVYYPFIEAETTYGITVLPGLRGINDKALVAPEVETLTTQPAKRIVEFRSQGSQLSPSISEGFSIETINADAVDIEFFRVKQEHYTQFLNSDYSSHIYYLQELIEIAELAYSARFDIDNKKNTRVESVLPVANIPQLQTPGLYVAVMKAAGSYEYELATTWFSISDIAFGARKSGDELVIFVHDVHSLAPQEGTKITVYNDKSKPVNQTTTDAQGFAKMTLSGVRANLVIAQKDQHFSVLRLNGPQMDLSEFGLPSREAKPLEFFMYGPRDLYRPGEMVNINGLLRNHDGLAVTPSPIQVKIYTPDSKTHQSFSWQGDATGFYEFELPLPERADRGQWQFTATLGNGDSFNYAFNVEDFLPERMALTLSTPAATGSGELAHTNSHEDLSINIQGDYLYGAPAAGNQLLIHTQAQLARTLFPKMSDVFFGIENYRLPEDYHEDNSHKLDDNGRAQYQLPNLWHSAEVPVRLKSKISLLESGGRPVTRSIEHIWWPRETAIGIQPNWQGNRANPESDISFNIVNMNKNGELQAADRLDVKVIRVDQNYYWQYRRNWEHSNRQGSATIFNQIVSIAAGEKRKVSLPVNYGNHRIEVRDSKTQQLLASYRFFAGWTWDRLALGEIGKPEQVKLAWADDTLKNGSEAKLTLTAPHTGLAIITVESDNLLWHTQQKVTEGENTVTIPIATQWDQHNIYATATVVRAAVDKLKDQQFKTTPKRAFGIIHLPLDRKARKIPLKITAPEKILPESPLSVAINTELNEGEEIFITLAAVDSGTLSISNFKTPDAHAWFFQPRAYRTAVRDTWAWFIEQTNSNIARQRFGGDAEVSRGGDAPTNDVQIVSLFSGKVALDKSGRAVVDFDIPYFNGELRLMAFAWSKQRQGTSEQTVKVAAPLVTQASTPRFLAFNDRSQAAFDLHNMTTQAQQLTIRAQADTALGGAELTQQITLAPNEKWLGTLPLVGQKTTGAGAITLAINSATNTNSTHSEIPPITRTWQLGLRPAFPALTQQTDVVIAPNSDFEQEITRSKFELSSQTLQLSLSPTPPLNAAEHFTQLMRYPYGCLEQTVSRAWPLLLSNREDLTRFGAAEELTTNTRAIIEQAISRISTMQRMDGSFALWTNAGNEAHWLTGYATRFLLDAKTVGFNVDDQLLANAIQRLQDYVNSQGRQWTENLHYSEYPDHYHFSYRAYAALVLAEQQRINLSQLRALYDNYSQPARTRLALAQIALALELAGDINRAQDAWQRAFAQSPSRRIYTGDYHTDVRDLAGAIELALRSQVVENPAQHVLSLRTKLMEQRWLSTQDRTTLFSLAKALEQGQNDQWQATVTYNQNPQTVNEITSSLAFNQVLRAQQTPTHLEINNPIGQPLYASFRHSGYPTVAPEPVSDGISVERFFLDQSGESINLSNVTTGDLILVKIDIAATEDQRIPDALVIDLLPPGLELENQNLASAFSIDDLSIDGDQISQWRATVRLVNEEFWDDRYLAAIDLNNNTSTLIYLARAVTPGEYQLPPTLVEDMYRPWLRAIGKDQGKIIINPR